jgi:hypothetical protein
VISAAPAQDEHDQPILERPHHLQVIGQRPPIELDTAPQLINSGAVVERARFTDTGQALEDLAEEETR